MNKLKLQYKADTGQSFKVNEIESFVSRGQVCVCVTDFPPEYVDGETLILPTAGYIEWLEQKVEELQKLTNQS